MAPPLPPQRMRRGLVFPSIAFAIATLTVQAAPTPAHFLGTRGQDEGKRKAALLARKQNDPGFFRSVGVRGGVQEEALGRLGESGSDTERIGSLFTRDSMAYNFNKLDNLEPVAPMDSLHAAVGRASNLAGPSEAVYVTKYLNPDAFPATMGKGCNCTMPKGKKMKCDCGKNFAKDNHYSWLKATPVDGTKNFTLAAADLTYPGGDKWGPTPEGGLASPMDALPAKSYPIQGIGEKVWPLPVMAREDSIGMKFARYIDQVQDRSEGCNPATQKCTVDCKPGDQVVATIGNMRLNAKIAKTFVGNAVMIEYAPWAAKKAKETTSCPIEATCSSFRFCKPPGKPCVNIKDKKKQNWAGMLVVSHECPKGSKVCKTVSQTLMANEVQKGGKPCKAAFKKAGPR